MKIQRLNKLIIFNAFNWKSILEKLKESHRLIISVVNNSAARRTDLEVRAEVSPFGIKAKELALFRCMTLSDLSWVKIFTFKG